MHTINWTVYVRVFLSLRNVLQTAKYGIAVSEQLTGLAPAVDPTQSFGALGVQSGAVLVCGVLEAEAKAAARDVLVVSVDGKLANTVSGPVPRAHHQCCAA